MATLVSWDDAMTSVLSRVLNGRIGSEQRVWNLKEGSGTHQSSVAAMKCFPKARAGAVHEMATQCAQFEPVAWWWTRNQIGRELENTTKFKNCRSSCARLSES